MELTFSSGGLPSGEFSRLLVTRAATVHPHPPEYLKVPVLCGECAPLQATALSGE